MRTLKPMIMAMFALLLTAGLTSCDEAEDVAEETGDLAEETGEMIEEGVDETIDAANEMEKEIDQGM